MGDEIAKSDFTDEDFAAFDQRLRQETDLLERWFEEPCDASDFQPVQGFLE